MPTIDYYFATVSPYAYLGHERFAAIARDAGATVRVKPVDIGRVFGESGGLPLAKRAPQRQAYRLVELARWRDHLGVPLNLQPRFFPCAADVSSKWILAANERDPAGALALAGAVGRALWAEERNPADTEVLSALARGVGLDPDATGARATHADIAAEYDRLTGEAIAAGVFGAPSYVVDGELFWGQDRLDFLARKLAR